jgi:hypothetical protein
MVRGLASDLPAGVDLSKAKGWCVYDRSGSAILGSYNVKSVTDGSTGKHTVNWAVPFKTTSYSVVTDSDTSTYNSSAAAVYTYGALVYVRNDAGTYASVSRISTIAFGELENE